MVKRVSMKKSDISGKDAHKSLNYMSLSSNLAKYRAYQAIKVRYDEANSKINDFRNREWTESMGISEREAFGWVRYYEGRIDAYLTLMVTYYRQFFAQTRELDED